MIIKLRKWILFLENPDGEEIRKMEEEESQFTEIINSIEKAVLQISMEILDLTNIKHGWEKINYQNRANMDLKCYLNIYKLNEELFLIYGGMEGRVSKRNVCLYNTVKNEVTKIGKELMEQIRKEAKNSRKLSSIITTISKESIV